MTVGARFVAMSLPRKLLLGAGGVLFIDSFLPWYHIDFGGFGSASANGWHGVGVVAWLLVIVLLALEGCRVAGVLPLDEPRADLVTLATAAGAVLFGLIFVIVRLSDGHLGFGFFIGVIALVVLAVGAVLMVLSSGAVAALKSIQASGGQTDGNNPPPPPPPPAP